MSALLTKPEDGNQNRAPQLLAIFWTQIPISLIFVCVRVYVRVSIRSMGMDDYMMLACWVLYLVALVGSTITVVNGGGRHLFYLTQGDVHTVLRWEWITQPFGIMALPFAKASISLLLLRIIGPRTVWRKWFLWINIGFFFLVSALASIFNYVQCNPPKALWDQVPGAKCWKSTVQPDFAIFVSSYSTFLDFCLAALPITIVWNLNLSLFKKFGLCVLLGLGTFTGICAAIKTAQLHELGSRADFTWATFSLYAWSSSELFLLVICGSMPALKPLYEKFALGKPMVSNKPRAYDSRGFSHVSSQRGKHSAKSTLTSNSGTVNSGTSTAQGDNGPILVEHTFDVELAYQEPTGNMELNEI